MSKRKMKRVPFDSSDQGSYPDARARFKHQTLMQDFLQLQEETQAARNKLDAMKRQKLTLLAEVRFLRRRYRVLMKNKSQNRQQEPVPVRPQYVEIQQRNIKKDKSQSRKEAPLRNLPPNYNLNQKGRVYMEKKDVHSDVTPAFALTHNDALHGVMEINLHELASEASKLNLRGRTQGIKQAGLREPMIVADLNHRQRINSGAALRNHPAPGFDLNVNKKESTFSSKEANGQSRPPIFDLNQISREEEEEFQENEPLSHEEVRKGLLKGSIDEQHDLKLSVCRNTGDGSTSRPRKRKISWQDPVALRV